MLKGRKWHQEKQMIKSSGSQASERNFALQTAKDNRHDPTWRWVSLKESFRRCSLNRLIIAQLQGKTTINSKHLFKFYQTYSSITYWPDFLWTYNSWSNIWQEKKKKYVRAVQSTSSSRRAFKSYCTCKFLRDYFYTKT